MKKPEFFSIIVRSFLKFILSVEEKKVQKINNAKKILIIRQHNQFGDVLASISLFRAVKQTFPGSYLTVIVSPQNHYALTQNKLVDELFIFEKNKILSKNFLLKLKKLLKSNYDIAITPSTVSISLTSILLMRFSDAEIKIGPNSLNGIENKYNFLFDSRIDLDWTKKPDAHVSDFGLDIVRPFGIKTNDFSSEITLTENDFKLAKKFIHELQVNSEQKLVGLHIGAGKTKNRWSLDKYIKLVEMLNNEFKLKFYLTGTNSDMNEINYFNSHSKNKLKSFLNKKIPELAALISMSDLFITNDTGVMHVAGTTSTPQISIFGPTNPFNWAPIGENKFFVRKSDLIDDVEVEEVFLLSKKILEGQK